MHEALSLDFFLSLAQFNLKLFAGNFYLSISELHWRINLLEKFMIKNNLKVASSTHSQIELKENTQGRSSNK